MTREYEPGSASGVRPLPAPQPRLDARRLDGRAARRDDRARRRARPADGALHRRHRRRARRLRTGPRPTCGACAARPRRPRPGAAAASAAAGPATASRAAPAASASSASAATRRRRWRRRRRRLRRRRLRRRRLGLEPEQVVGARGLGEAAQRQLPHRLRDRDALGGREHALADQDLPARRRSRTAARRASAPSPPARTPSGARSRSARSSRARAPRPRRAGARSRAGSSPRPAPTRGRAARPPAGRPAPPASSHGSGSLKTTISSSAVSRTSVPSAACDQLAERGVVGVEHAHHVLGLGLLGQRGEAVQRAEDDRDLAPVDAQHGRVGLDQLGHLRAAGSAAARG